MTMKNKNQVLQGSPGFYKVLLGSVLWFAGFGFAGFMVRS